MGRAWGNGVWRGQGKGRKQHASRVLEATSFTLHPCATHTLVHSCMHGWPCMPTIPHKCLHARPCVLDPAHVCMHAWPCTPILVHTPVHTWPCTLDPVAAPGEALSSLLSAILAALQPACGAILAASLAPQGALRIFDFLGNTVLEEVQATLAAEMPGEC